MFFKAIIRILIALFGIVSPEAFVHAAVNWLAELVEAGFEIEVPLTAPVGLGLDAEELCKGSFLILLKEIDCS